MEFNAAVPILRIFSVEKAEEFYVGFLGFTVDWRHRFHDTAPLYMQVSRGGLRLHLSEHHGDATPGSAVFVEMKEVRELHRELSDRHYPYARPGLESQPWGFDELVVSDPFGNRLRFAEKRAT